MTKMQAFAIVAGQAPIPSMRGTAVVYLLRFTK